MKLYPGYNELDRALATSAKGDVIVLENGVYTTRGNWTAKADAGWCNLPAEVAIRGEGVGRTIVRWAAIPEGSSNGVIRADRDLTLFWGDVGSSIERLTLDTGIPTNPAWNTNGLRFHGQFTVRDIAILGVRGDPHAAGTLHKEIESFALTATGDTAGSLVDAVSVSKVAPNTYVSGICLGRTVGVGGMFSTIRDCSVNLGAGNQAAFTASNRVLVSGCHGYGARFGFYHDTGDISEVQIIACHFTGEWSAIGVRAASGTAMCGPVRVSNSGLTGPRGLELVFGTSADFQVEITDSLIKADWLAALDIPTGKAFVRIENCTVPEHARTFRTKPTSLRPIMSNLHTDYGVAVIPEDYIAP